MYLALEQVDSNTFILTDHLAIRSALRPVDLAGIVKSKATELSQGAAVFEVTSMEKALAEPLARPRFNASLLMGLATATLAQTASGLFATMSALVQQRTREICVRVALGARPSDVGRAIVRHGVILATLGTAAGLAAATGAAGFIRRLLFGVGPADPLTLAVTALLAMIVALAACCERLGLTPC
jgi:putative ABC transport system permease protein